MMVELTRSMCKGLLLMILLCITGGCYWYFNVYDPLETTVEETSGNERDHAEDEEESEVQEEGSEIAVHVSGAVQHPDQVYYLPQGSRVIDAIAAAGDALAEGDLSQLNLARVLQDGERVYVPLLGEETLEADGGTAQDITENPQNPLTNINLATTIELQELPGIGEVYAQRIVEYREANGDFQSIEDIKNVSGIGDSTFEKIKDRITVSP